VHGAPWPGCTHRSSATGDPSQEDPRLEDLAEIRKAGDRARDLTAQLLAVARRQVVEPKVLDLNAVLQDSERLLRRLLREDVQLVVKLEPGLWPVMADPAQLQLDRASRARWWSFKRGSTTRSPAAGTWPSRGGPADSAAPRAGTTPRSSCRRACRGAVAPAGGTRR
jgi:hypothetical protein